MKTIFDFVSVYDRFVFSGFMCFLIILASYYLHERGIRNSGLFVHRFVLRPDYAPDTNGKIKYISWMMLATRYELQDKEFVIMDKNYVFQPTDIVLPVLTEGGYVQFKEEAVKWFYAKQEAYAESYAFQQQ